MEKTWRDLKKLSSTSMTITKKAVYYGFIPLVVILGLRTVNIENFTGQAPMWFDFILCYFILNFYLKNLLWESSDQFVDTCRKIEGLDYS